MNDYSDEDLKHAEFLITNNYVDKNVHKAEKLAAAIARKRKSNPELFEPKREWKIAKIYEDGEGSSDVE